MENKTIKKCNEIVDKRIQKLQEKKDEAQRSYNDTGYERYYTQICNAEIEISELREYKSGGWPVVLGLETRVDYLEKQFKELKERTSSLDDDDFTSPRVRDLINYIERLS